MMTLNEASGVPESSEALELSSRMREVASNHLNDLFARYRCTGEPLPISFRELVGPIPAHDHTHSVHPYPARLLRQVPRFFLNCDQLGIPGDLVLDPFCGSGTVLVESIVRGRLAWGSDSNPLARLLSQVKTTPIDTRLTRLALNSALAQGKAKRAVTAPNVVNIDRWYSPAAKSVLTRFASAVGERADPPEIRRFLLVTLSFAANRLSLRDPRIPVPVLARDAVERRANQSTQQCWHLLEVTGKEIAEKIGLLRRLARPGIATILGTDARTLDAVHATSSLPQPNLTITSPPYGAAQKYIRSSSLSLGWLRLADVADLSELEHQSIGREHMVAADRARPLVVAPACVAEAVERISDRDTTRGLIYGHYFSDMKQALESTFRLTTPGGHLVLVAASNTVAGERVESHRLLAAIAESIGFERKLELKDQIRGRVLMTRRAASAGTPIGEEQIYVLRKPRAT